MTYSKMDRSFKAMSKLMVAGVASSAKMGATVATADQANTLSNFAMPTTLEFRGGMATTDKLGSSFDFTGAPDGITTTFSDSQGLYFGAALHGDSGVWNWRLAAENFGGGQTFTLEDSGFDDTLEVELDTDVDFMDVTFDVGRSFNVAGIKARLFAGATYFDLSARSQIERFDDLIDEGDEAIVFDSTFDGFAPHLGLTASGQVSEKVSLYGSLELAKFNGADKIGTVISDEIEGGSQIVEEFDIDGDILTWDFGVAYSPNGNSQFSVGVTGKKFTATEGGETSGFEDDLMAYYVGYKINF